MKSKSLSKYRPNYRPMQTVKVMQRILLPFIGLALLAAVQVPSMATAVKWPEGPYPYVPVNQSVRDVLHQFEMNTGIRVRLSDGVKGQVDGALPQDSAQAFLDGLARRLDIDWVYDGDGLALSARAERETRTLPLDGVDFAVLRQSLAQADLLDDRYDITRTKGRDAVSVSGPPAYADVVARMLRTLEPAPPAAREAGGELVIMRGAAVSRQAFP
jgi:type III secretion protein C